MDGIHTCLVDFFVSEAHGILCELLHTGEECDAGRCWKGDVDSKHEGGQQIRRRAR